MKSTDMVLGILVLALAASSGILAWQVREERRSLAFDGSSSDASHDNATAALAVPGDSRARSAARDPAGGGAADATSSASSSPAGQRKPFRRAPTDVQIRVHYELMPKLWQDPAGRRALIEEEIPSMRDLYLPLQRKLKMDEDLWRRFLELVAEQSVAIIVSRSDCLIANNCEGKNLTADQYERELQRIRDLLGPERTEKVVTFRESGSDRRMLTTLQSELPLAMRLDETRSEELVAALGAVRRKTVQELSRSGTPAALHSGVGGLLVYDPRMPDAKSRIEFATRYSEQLRDSAAAVLTGVQLTTYRRLQDETLESLRQRLKDPKPRG